MRNIILISLLIYLIEYYCSYSLSFIIFSISLLRYKIKKLDIILLVFFIYILLFFFFTLDIIEIEQYVIKNNISSNLYISKFVLLFYSYY